MGYFLAGGDAWSSVEGSAFEPTDLGAWYEVTRGVHFLRRHPVSSRHLHLG